MALLSIRETSRDGHPGCRGTWSHFVHITLVTSHWGSLDGAWRSFRDGNAYRILLLLSRGVSIFKGFNDTTMLCRFAPRHANDSRKQKGHEIIYTRRVLRNADRSIWTELLSESSSTSIVPLEAKVGIRGASWILSAASAPG